jgi:hypothetical protein
MRVEEMTWDHHELNWILNAEVDLRVCSTPHPLKNTPYLSNYKMLCLMLTMDWDITHQQVLARLGFNQPITRNKQLYDRWNRSMDRLGWSRARLSPQKPRNTSPEDPLGRSTPRVALGLARSPRMPMDLAERCNTQQDGWKMEKLDNRCKNDDWMLDNSIGHDPLVYIEGVVLYPSRKPFQDVFSKFHTSSEEFGSESKRPDLIWVFY